MGLSQRRDGECRAAGSGSGAAPSGEAEAHRARLAALEAAAEAAQERSRELQAELARQSKRCGRTAALMRSRQFETRQPDHTFLARLFAWLTA